MSEEKLDKGFEENQEEDYLFAKAEVVRLMRDNLSKDKQIKERVKIGMNIFLSNILKEVCAELDKYPYTTIEYEMLKECIYPYTNIKYINQERMRILAHLNAIKSDCDALSMDVEKTLRLNENKNEEYKYVPLTSEARETE